MKYRKWDSKTKAKIVLEGLQNKISLVEQEKEALEFFGLVLTVMVCLGLRPKWEG